MDQYLFPMKKSSDKKHRISQVIQNIKDYILKRKFNQAWDYAAKYYEQNKSSLRNDQVYQLCWLSCQSINKKIKTRLMASPKSYLPTLTEAHFQHLFSLYLSLHSQLFPQIRSNCPQYFSMLSVTETVINPKSISTYGLIFQRKEGQLFMQGQQSNKQLKKLVKLHLRVTNNTLMFRVKTRKRIEDVIQTIKQVQQIVDSFGNDQFPVQSINFQLIKLSIKQELKIKQGIKCEYRLPIGLINKIYRHLKGNKDEAVNHYVKKLTSYMVLSFRNLPLTIQEMYIICQQMIFLTKVIQEKATPHQNFGLKTKLKNMKINRQITIQGPIEQNGIGMNKSIKSSFSNSFSTNNKLSQKKLESKTKLGKPEGLLKSIAMLALEKINKYLQGRKQINHILLTYFPKSYFDNLNNDPLDEIIQNYQIPLLTNTRNKKQKNEQQQYHRKSKTQTQHSLSEVIRQKSTQKKVVLDKREEKEALLQSANKNEGKFITRNIKNIQRPAKADEYISKKLLNIVNNSEIHRVDIIDESSSDEEANLQHFFQRQRRVEINNVNKKYSLKIYQQYSNNNSQQLQQGIVSDQNMTIQCKDQGRARSISLLDDVVNNQINQILQLPSKHNSQRQTTLSLKKLQNLKMQVQNLNVQRALQVQKLTSRSNKVFLNDTLEPNVNLLDDYQNKRSQKTSNFNSKLSLYKASNRYKLQKESKLQINNQPKIKLKLDKQGRKAPQLTFAQLQEQYKILMGLSTDKKEGQDMFLSCHYDKLRRDVSKNQFASQNQTNNKKAKCKTILEKTHQDQINNE